MDTSCTIGHIIARAQQRGKSLTTSGDESENVLKELYKASEMTTQTKLFKQFNKLLNHYMDEDTKRDHKLPLRN